MMRVHRITQSKENNNLHNACQWLLHTLQLLLIYCAKCGLLAALKCSQQQDTYALPLTSSLQNNRSDLGDTPLYDYKMVDGDWLLLPAAAEYFLRTPQVR